MNYDPLIYGIDQTERIVSLEPRDDQTEVFIEDANGYVTSKFVPHSYWILSSKPLAQNFTKLDGNLQYRYMSEYHTRKDFERARFQNKHNDTFSIYNAKEASMVRSGMTYFKGMKHDEVSILAFDIESTSLDHGPTAKVLIITNTFRRKGEVVRKLFAYSDYADEGEMIQAWCEWVRKIDPSVICGHNIFTYDLPYLQAIADKFGVEMLLGRDDSAIEFDSWESRFRKDATQEYTYKKAHIYGREMVDTLFLSIRYDIGRKYENYKLKDIIAHEGLEVKDRVFYDASLIRKNYTNLVEWEKIKAYALNDADDALSLYDLMSPPFFYITQSVAKPYQLILESASGSQINSVMMRSYLQDNHSLPAASPSSKFEGAISLGNPGIYKNVYKIDVASLYPSIMIECEVYDEQKDPKAYFLKLVKTFTERRLEHKKLAKTDKYYDDLQNAEKIFINSCYGFLGTNGLNFNSPSGASFVTETGRNILKTAIDWAEAQGFKIVNADTDSISFCHPDGKEMSEQERKDLLAQCNSLFPERIRFEDDGYYKTIIVVKAKNYILWDGKKLKHKGSAIKASTKEPALKQFIKDLVDIMIAGDKKEDIDLECILAYNRYAKEIMKISDIKRWATRKTVTASVLNPKRTNEEKVKAALGTSEYSEGDRAYFFFRQDGSLSLADNFDGTDYDTSKLLEKLYKTGLIFSTVLDTKTMFINYKLKRNAVLLQELIAKDNNI